MQEEDMQRVEEPMETIHLYVVREEGKRPYSLLPLLFALLCLVAIVALTLYSGEHPYVEHETIRVPAHFLPLKYFTTKELIIPTGVKTYPATRANGIITLYNGSIAVQQLPAGLIITSNNDVEVITDASVIVPAGNPPNFGIATISAHSVIQGKQGNIQGNTINQVIGSSLYVRNTSLFNGGRDAYSISYTTPQDRLMALSKARATLSYLVPQAMLDAPCKEDNHSVGADKLVVAWACQYVSYTPPVFFKIVGVEVKGKNVVLYGYPVVQTRRVWFK